MKIWIIEIVESLGRTGPLIDGSTRTVKRKIKKEVKFLVL